MKRILIALAAGLMATGAALAQAPAGAPAGAMGICKDGTYSTQSSKMGACRGHKGVQTWYGSASTSTVAVPATAMAKPASAAAAAPAPMAARPTAPMTSPAPAMQSSAPVAAAASKRLSPAQAAAQKPMAPGGGPGMVWVNTSSNVYHCNGDAFYGKTKEGKYMTEAQAQAAGAHGDRGKTCAGK
jgi:hypothetical protein